MSDEWEDVKVEGKPHYTAEITKFDIGGSGDVKMNLKDENNLYEDTIRAYSILYEDESGDAVGVIKSVDVSRVMSKYFYDKFNTRGFAVPKVILDRCKANGLDRFRLRVRNGDKIIAFLEASVDDLLKNGRKFWAHERQYYAPFVVWEDGYRDEVQNIYMTSSYREWKDRIREGE